jgi:hypothetical protein
VQALFFLKGIGYLTSVLGPNSNTNLFEGFGFELTSKQATDSDLRPYPKDSVKSRSGHMVLESSQGW